MCRLIARRTETCPVLEKGETRLTVPVKRHRGEPGHTRDTQAHTRTHGGHSRTSQPSKPNDTPARPRDSRNPKPRPTQQQQEQPQARTPEPTTPRGRLRRGRPQRTRPCLHPLPERLPAPASKAVGEMKASRESVPCSRVCPGLPATTPRCFCTLLYCTGTGFWCLRPPRCVSTGPVVVRLAGMANERERERVQYRTCIVPVYRYVTNSSQATGLPSPPEDGEAPGGARAAASRGDGGGGTPGERAGE